MSCPVFPESTWNPFLAGTQPSGSSALWNTDIKPEIVDEVQPNGEKLLSQSSQLWPGRKRGLHSPSVRPDLPSGACYLFCLLLIGCWTQLWRKWTLRRYKMLTKTRQRSVRSWQGKKWKPMQTAVSRAPGRGSGADPGRPHAHRLIQPPQALVSGVVSHCYCNKLSLT